MPEFEFSHLDNAPVVKVSSGIRLHQLWESADGPKALIVEMDAGAYLGVEVHEQGPEVAYVIEGVFDDGTVQHPAGSFIYCHKGSSHVPQSDVGCKVFFFYPQG